MKKESYEQRVKREESAHCEQKETAKLKKSWRSLSDKEYAAECNAIDSRNFSLWKAGLTK